MINPAEETKVKVECGSSGPDTKGSAEGVAFVQDLPNFLSDNRRYRWVRLPNGFRALLIENNRAALAKVLMRVAVGSFHEPPEHPGLAHFLEHMLFMGCKKYPNEDEFHSFIEHHNGDYNGSTGDENTEFNFEIDLAHLEGALDRFGHFLSTPSLKPECAERELSAIQNEFDGNVEEDSFRTDCVDKVNVNPKHPAHRFDFGNRDSLKITDKLLAALRHLYNTYYKAKHMLLIVESNHTLDKLAAMITDNFALISSDDQPLPKMSKVPRYTHDQMGVRTHMASVEKNNKLIINFMVPEKRSLEIEQALSYILPLLRDRSPGSVFDILKNKGWIKEQCASGDPFSVNTSFYDESQWVLIFGYPLTELGLMKIDEITFFTIKFIQFIQQRGIDTHFFKELQDCGERLLNRNADGLNADLSVFLHTLTYFPINHFFVGAMIRSGTPFRVELIRSILDKLAAATEEHIQQFVLQDTMNEEGCETEHYTKAKYKRTQFSLQPLQETKEMHDIPFALSIPCTSVPTDFSIISMSGNFNYPRLIFNDKRLRLFLSHDHHFTKPNIMTRCYFMTHLTRASAFNAMACLMYTHLVINILTKQIARELGLTETQVKIDLSPKGLALVVEGYSHKHEDILLKIIELMAAFVVDPHNFKTCLDTLISAELSIKTKPPYAQCSTNLEMLLNQFNYAGNQNIRALQQMTPQKLQTFVHLLMKSCVVEIYSHGNILPADLIALGKKIVETLGTNADSHVLPQSKIVCLPAGAHFRHLLKTQIHNKGLVFFLQASDNSSLTKRLLSILANLMKSKYFDLLRTKESLCYTIGCERLSLEDYSGLTLFIESSEYSADYLRLRTEEFLLQFAHELSVLSEAEFLSCRESLEKTIPIPLLRPKSPSDFALNFEPRFNLGKYQFPKILDDLEPRETITLSMLQAFYQTFIAEDTRRQLVVQTDELYDELKDIPFASPTSDGTGVLKLIETVMSYHCEWAAESYLKSGVIADSDIELFKQSSSYFPDPMASGLQSLQATLEFNRGCTLEEGNMVDVDPDELGALVVLTLQPSKTLVQLLETIQSTLGEPQHLSFKEVTSSASNLVLTYCFGEYQSTKKEDARRNAAYRNF